MVKWIGLDYGETVMNPFTLHQSELIRSIYRRLGKEGEAEERVQMWYALRDSVGAKFAEPNLRAREVKQYARGRIYSDVLGGVREAARLYDGGEAKGFTPARGVKEALMRLKRDGVPAVIVSESSSTTAAMAISRFLRVHGLRGLFREVITPAGRFGVGGELLGAEFEGKTKRDGTMYDQLREYLSIGGVRSEDAAMVGDDPVLDIANSKQRGFVAVQYTGVVDRGASVADYVIDDWSKLPW